VRRSVPLEHAVQLAPVGDPELGEDLVQVVLDRARADEEVRADLRVDSPSRASRATCASCAVRSSRVSSPRLRAVSPVASSSRRARAANASAPMALNMSCATRS